MLCQGILKKFTGCRLQYFINDMLSRDFQEIFQNNLFAEHLKVIVSVIINGLALPQGTYLGAFKKQPNKVAINITANNISKQRSIVIATNLHSAFIRLSLSKSCNLPIKMSTFCNKISAS